MDISRFVAEAIEQGWSVQPGFLDSDRVTRLTAAARELWKRGSFYKAGIGRGTAHRVRPDIRGDHILWLDECDVPCVQRFLSEDLEALRLALNSAGYLGLHEFEGHFAVYPPDTHYARHYDRFHDNDERVFTVTLYLNPDWQEEDGGQLMLYPGTGNGEPVSVLPAAGTLVGFISAGMAHEVLPSRRERFSLTGWFRRRP